MPHKTQLLILDSLHTFHAARCQQLFARKADESEEEKKTRWGTFNDSLRRIIFGTYKAATLPPYVQTEIRELACPRWKSFFIQRILVYHSHVTSKKNPKLDPLLGVYDLENKIKTLQASYFKDIKLPPPAQQPAEALLPPPPPAALQPDIPPGEAVVAGPADPAQQGAAAADVQPAPAAPLPEPPQQPARRRILTMHPPKPAAQGTTGIPAHRPKRNRKRTRRGSDDDDD